MEDAVQHAVALKQSRGASSQVIHRKVLAEIRGMDGPFLDLGCGTGEFLELLHADGKADLTGCDAYRHADGRPASFRFVESDLNQRLAFSDSSFRVVTAIEVIEHLENPRHLIREIARLLMPGGLAVVTTPNNESLLSLLSLTLRGHYSAFADSCYPAHITPLLKVDLKRMLTEAGLEKIRFSYTDSGRIPGTAKHWPGFFRGERFSDNQIVCARKPETK